MSKRPSLENRLARLVFIATALPGAAVLLCLWLLDSSVYVLGSASFMLICLVVYASLQVRNSVDYQFRSMQNVLEAVKEGDYSLRIATSNRDGALREVVATVNGLVAALQAEKQRTEEHQLLLNKVTEQIDVAILAWDTCGQISFMNPSARQLLNFHLQNPAAEAPLKLPPVIQEIENLPLKKAQVLELELGESGGRYRLYKDQYFIGGDSLALLFITNIDTLLKKEEKRAWQNLIRVISHEINNSLAPIASMSESLRKQVRNREQDAQLAQELDEGLGIVQGRSEALSEFLARYREIVGLREPAYGVVALPGCVEGLARLFPQATIVLKGEALQFTADVAQFQQLMINLVKNAVEAQESSEPSGQITMSWQQEGRFACISVADEGQGVQNPENLFVPLYSTKKQGQGIGLVLCKEIVEAHGGSISLANRRDRQGCVVLVKLPLAPSEPWND